MSAQMYRAPCANRPTNHPGRGAAGPPGRPSSRAASPADSGAGGEGFQVSRRRFRRQKYGLRHRPGRTRADVEPRFVALSHPTGADI